MGFEIVVPKSVNGGFYKRIGNWCFALMGHTLQCDQRWIFLIRWHHFMFGYRTMGDATPKLMTSKDAGWWWPWQTKRTCAGRW